MNTRNIGAALMALLAMGLFFTACEDEPDKYEISGGTPTIRYIRPVDVDSKDSLLYAASLGSTICVVGSNLRSVVQVDFNDQTAVLNTSYITDNTLIVTVPNNLPGTVTDKIYFITQKADTVAYDFEVTVPAPVIYSMSNEWAAAGEEVTLVGDYFLDYDSYALTITVGDGYTLDRDYISSISKTSIVFTMPDDFPQNETICVNTQHGTGEAAFEYMDNRGMLFDFDTPNSATGVVLDNYGWNGHSSSTDDTALSGNFMQLGNGEAVMSGDNSTWNETWFSFVYWCGGSWDGLETYETYPRLFDVVSFADWQNMSLKFEMNIPSEYPWMAGSLQICFAGTDLVTCGGGGVDIYGNTVAAANNTYFTDDSTPRALYRPWTDTGSYDTGGQWQTVTISLADSFVFTYSGGTSTGSLSTSSFASVWFFVANGGIAGTDCTPVIKIDNIRVVPN